MLLLAADSASVRRIPVAPAETLVVTTRGAGPPLLIVPGLIGSAYAFRKIVPPLAAAGLAVSVVEPLGVGASSRPEKSDYSFTAQARRIAAVLDSLGIQGCVPVLAHSLGVAMAFRLALLQPERVCGILAENGGPQESVATSSVRRAVKYAWLIKLVAGRGRVRSQIRKGLLETAGDSSWVTTEVIDHYTEGPAGDLGAVLRALKGMARSSDPDSLAPQLGRITVPVRLLVGGAPNTKGIPPAHTALLAARLPHLVVDTVPGAGLHIHEEQPDAVVKAVLELVRQLTPQRAPPSGPARSSPRRGASQPGRTSGG
ncbi:MAG TPA: alpha/beta hydrolase [Gemmatimonadales bacterium]|nr:alpha/beta hydrolase [Gemmatimonadales bacterium]